MDKKSLTEEDIKLRFITPAIVEKAGWQKELIKMEYYFTDGRVIFQGNVHARKQGKKADYLLHYSANNPIAIVEAKDNNKAVGAGLQQAMDYAKILDIPLLTVLTETVLLSMIFLLVRKLILIWMSFQLLMNC